MRRVGDQDKDAEESEERAFGVGEGFHWQREDELEGGEATAYVENLDFHSYS